MKHRNTKKSEFFFFFLTGKGWVEFEYIIFGLNGFFFKLGRVGLNLGILFLG